MFLRVLIFLHVFPLLQKPRRVSRVLANGKSELFWSTKMCDTIALAEISALMLGITRYVGEHTYIDVVAIASQDQYDGASRSMTPTQPSPASPLILYGTEKKPPLPQRPFSDPTYLAPEDAFYAHSPPRRQRQPENFTGLYGDVPPADGTSLKSAGSARRRRAKERGRSGSRRGKGVWKKLLWVKQKDCLWHLRFVRVQL